MGAETIISVISVLGSAIGTFAGIAVNSRLVNFRIEQLEKKVDMHNRVIERVYKLEKLDAVLEKELKVANHRIEDLEGYHK